MPNPELSLEPTAARLRFDHFEIDEAEARLMSGGKPLALAPKPFAVLCTLARAPQMLVTKNFLLDTVWGHRFVSESVLKSAISEVRSTLGDDPRRPRYIETVSRRGYRFIATPVAVPSKTVALIDRNRSLNAALTALTTLCQGDARLADLIRSVAATLEFEPPVLDRVDLAERFPDAAQLMRGSRFARAMQ